MDTHATARRRKRQRGNEIIEFTFVMVPLMGMLFVTIDIAWALYSAATLQSAVQQGARLAMSSRTDQNGVEQTPAAQIAQVRKLVIRLSNGIIKSKDASIVSVNWYAPSNLEKAIELNSGNEKPGGANKAWNIVEVSIKDIPVKALLPVFGQGFAPLPSTLTFNFSSADRMD